MDKEFVSPNQYEKGGAVAGNYTAWTVLSVKLSLQVLSRKPFKLYCNFNAI